MKVHFITPTRISLINLTTIGDSEKREDETKIGKFSSGQAYATALLLRDGVDMKISVFGGYGKQPFTEYITYNTKTRYCNTTHKKKDIIELHYKQVFHGGSPNSVHDFNEPSPPNGMTIETAFALQLGYNWEVWMAYRELMSNVLDEGGYVVEENFDEDSFIETGEESTVITLTFDENNKFYNVWQNRHLYMNFEEPLFKVSNSVEALKNNEGYLRIYKQNILVYENKEKPSRFAWNIKFGEIDERRILNNVYSIEQSISSAIQGTKNEEFLREIITNDFEVKEEEFLSSNSTYSNWISDNVKKVVYEVYEQYGNVQSYSWLIEKVKKQRDCKIGGKKITTIEDSLWSYSKEVTIETLPQSYDEIEYTTPFASEIKKHYNFKLDVEVKIAKLKGSKVIADKYEKCLIVDEKFNVENDFHDFIVQYLDLTQEGNVIDNLAKYICNLIKK